MYDKLAEKETSQSQIAVAFQDELGRVPKEDEIDQVFLIADICKMLRISRATLYRYINVGQKGR